ncbi:MAG: hypothetical protein A2Z77_06240 [Chloroflexi bacterium RBG_13_51_36]|nr:MAG: hypothetical protein A2Z77_06240 [Chloroflexi bacterium RBG_13_51_36]
MKNRKELKQEYDELVVRYFEEHEKYRELFGQFASGTQIEVGKPISSPKRALDAAAIKEIREAERKLDKLRKEMIEARNRLYES